MPGKSEKRSQREGPTEPGEKRDVSRMGPWGREGQWVAKEPD